MSTVSTRAGLWRSALVAVVCWAVAACSSLQGVEEFEVYRPAFEKTYAASTAILDQLAVQERTIFLRRHRVDAAGTRNPEFDPDLARYYTDAVDPPGTAAFRHSLDAVKAYNDLLYGLASGQTAATLAAKITTLNDKLADASNETGAVLKLAGLAKLTELGALLRAASTQAQPIVQFGLTLRSRDEFRRYAVEYHALIRAILLELRQGTTAIFPVLTASTMRRARTAVTSADGKLTPQEIEKLEAYRKLLADWVILIDTTIKALDQVKAAVEADPTIGGTIVGLTTMATELETTSQAARKHLADLAAK